VANRKTYSSEARRRINRAVRREEARIDGRELPGPPVGDGPLPRTYRPFTLTEQLDAGSSAAVEWDDGTTGEVHDTDTCCWGLAGETGEAAAYPDDDDGVQWRVVKNPGQGIYRGSLDSAAGSTGATDVSISIAGEDVTLSAMLRANPGTGMQWPIGATVYVGHFRGSWEIVSITSCPEDTP
jgi:hypothetical protein